MQYIYNDQIIQLLNKYPLGIRLKFNYYIKQWQKSLREGTLHIPSPRKQSESASSIVISTGSESKPSKVN